MGKNDITMRECVRLAQELIDSGEAMRKLENFVRVTNEVGDI
jgi:anthranilate phosphoribosyltransferase